MMYDRYKHLTSPTYGRPDDQQVQSLQKLTAPHIESFNYIIHGALSRAVQNIPAVHFALPNGDRVSLSYVDAGISSPVVAPGNTLATTLKVYPCECRERATTYKGRLVGHVVFTVNGVTSQVMERNLGDIPIMVKSDVCNLARLSPAQLITKGEEQQPLSLVLLQEMGGYFIINGLEKVVRMLIMPRRNYPMCINRPSWKNRGKLYTEYGVTMRCIGSDNITSAHMVLHYLSNGTVNVAFTCRKEQFFVPVIFILKALLSVPDSYIYSQLIAGDTHDSFFKGCVTHMLRCVLNEGLSSQASILKYIGDRFRVKVSLPEWYSDEEVTQYILRKCVCIHVDDFVDKFNILIHMTRKLFTFARGKCAPENPDSTMNHEVLLPGHLYLMVLREKMENWLYSLKTTILRNAQKSGEAFHLNSDAMHSCMTVLKEDVSRPMEYLLATGNVISRTGLGLMQTSGFSTVADKLNIVRYLSHFRSIHRGAYFAEMRTTSARKLLPEAWGFICPVHTPDGAPCGLLNHLSQHCQVVNRDHICPDLPSILTTMGVTPPSDLSSSQGTTGTYVMLLDGRLVGYVRDELVHVLEKRLRAMKILQLQKVPSMMEVCLIPKTNQPSQYPGLYLFTSVARMMRPVTNIAHNAQEMVGTFEQVYMDISLTHDENIPQVTTHLEIEEGGMLSAVASLTPYSDFNQSPRNMYQCQMAKQTMATPCHAIHKRADNKLYRLLIPQSPIVRPQVYDQYSIDEYPLGTNAVVAVISYTGYDMEDAMVINKASYERGFGHGSVYKSEMVDLNQKKNRMTQSTFVFGLGDKSTETTLDYDGLPPVGTYLEDKHAFYSYVDVNTGDAKVVRYTHDEGAYVEQIKILGNDTGTGHLNHVCFLLRVPRNPIIGDKFASRHGQKGICSMKWPVENMPFSESGITPDILFNPHGYPSRMTIGMMIESMAGKCASMAGVCHDATPFTFSEQNSAIDFFAQSLTQAGYNYYGTEPMYSGISGCHFEADIFMGVVYYQRLRHMVSDKFQVRTTGPIDNLTHQPVKGRKRQGGVRFGEMERDAIVAHGSSFVLQDRLFNCSDKSLVCNSKLVIIM